MHQNYAATASAHRTEKPLTPEGEGKRALFRDRDRGKRTATADSIFWYGAKRALRHAFYRAELEAVAVSRIGRLWPAAAGRGLIFCLHHVRPDHSASDLTAYLTVTPRYLAQTITAAVEAGLTPVALEDLPNLLADPSDHRKFVCFTLDDGYRDNAEHAAPVFRSFGVPYTIFLVGGFVDRTRAMWWETARELITPRDSLAFDFGNGPETLDLSTSIKKLMAYDRIEAYTHRVPEDRAVAQLDELARAHGIDSLGIVDRVAMNAAELQRLADDPLAHFGAHTLTHVNLLRVDDDRLRKEVVGSGDAVERILGRRPTTFAFPYGGVEAAGDREKRAVAAAGYDLAVTTRPFALSTESIREPTGIPRVTLKGEYQNRRCADALVTGVPFKIRW